MAKRLTPKDVFDYVVSLTSKERGSGTGTRYPKLSEVCRHFGTRQDVIEELVEEGTDEGYLGLAVGFSNGSAYYEIKKKSDYLVEAY